VLGIFALQALPAPPRHPVSLDLGPTVPRSAALFSFGVLCFLCCCCVSLAPRPCACCSLRDVHTVFPCFLPPPPTHTHVLAGNDIPNTYLPGVLQWALDQLLQRHKPVLPVPLPSRLLLRTWHSGVVPCWSVRLGHETGHLCVLWAMRSGVLLSHRVDQCSSSRLWWGGGGCVLG
jgi:hypothetical protein